MMGVMLGPLAAPVFMGYSIFREESYFFEIIILIIIFMSVLIFIKFRKFLWVISIPWFFVGYYVIAGAWI
jgi:hypothetical protein